MCSQGLVVGHRGCRGYPGIPENSLASFKYAIERGAAAIELDCRLTKDGEVVVIHDDHTWRLTHQKQSISSLTLAEVRKLTYRLPDGHETSESIPTLHEVMQLVSHHNVKVFIEIKCSDWSATAVPLAQKVAALIKEFSAHKWACVIAFNPSVLYRIRLIDHEIETCMLFCENYFESAATSNLETVSFFLRFRWVYRALDPLMMILCKHVFPELIGCTMIGPHYHLTHPRDVHSYKKRGFGTYVWVPNTPTDSQFYLDVGCSVGTDCVFPKTCHRGLRSSAENVKVCDD